MSPGWDERNVGGKDAEENVLPSLTGL
jgi:hypothetical protein